MAALGQSPPSASRGCPCAAPLVLAACCTPARVCISLSFVLAARCPIVYTRLSRRPSAALTALQELLYQSLQALIAFESATPGQPPPEQLQPCRLPVPSHPSCPCAAVQAGSLPAASSAGAGRAGRPQARTAAGRVAAGWADAVGGKGRLIFLSPAALTALESKIRASGVHTWDAVAGTVHQRIASARIGTTERGGNDRVPTLLGALSS
jgi:hypothetical protein